VPLTSEQQVELESVKEQRFETKRVSVPELEEVLYEPLPVLDHGFIRVVDYMGDDAAIVQAARVSYGAGTKRARDDSGLINYLMRHWHTSPFEMCEIKLHVKLPIFVARQWIRHRTANVNEYSARYSILDREFYVPDAAHLAGQSAANRQGRADLLEGDEAKRVFEILKGDAQSAYDHYEEMLNENSEGEVLDEGKAGLARELARMNLPVSFYTQWYWKTDLHNLMHFIRLRADGHAQYEIRAYADVLYDLLRRWVPITAEAFDNHRAGAANLSKNGLAAVRALLAGKNVEPADFGLSKREWRELRELLELDQPAP
jgi:thymidylate synthase (FAD)